MMALNSYHKLNEIETHLITWGDPFNCDGNDVILCVTGNPGIPDFYEEFGTVLHERTKFPVCVVGQSGHAVVPDKESNNLESKEHLFNLQAQLKHKLELIQKIVKNRSKVHLIGHSIGSWIIIEILEHNPELINHVKTVNLLFPTVQRMADTWSGFYVNKILRNINYVIILFITLLSLLPKTLIDCLISLYLWLYSLPQHYTQRITKMLHPRVFEKVLFLAYDEMDSVLDLNVNCINKIKHLTYVVYSDRDQWAPLTYMEDFKQFLPELQMREVNIDHSFVLKSSEEVAEMVSNNIKK